MHSNDNKRLSPPEGVICIQDEQFATLARKAADEQKKLDALMRSVTPKPKDKNND